MNFDEKEYQEVLKKLEKTPKEICPNCLTKEFFVPIWEGYPNNAIFRLENESKIHIFGCYKLKNPPKGFCNQCRKYIK